MIDGITNRIDTASIYAWIATLLIDTSAIT